MNCFGSDEGVMEMQTSDRYFHWFLTVSISVIICLTAFGMSATRTTVALGPLIPRVALLFFLLGLCLLYRWRKEPRLSNLFIIVFWSVFITNVHIYPMVVASRCKVEMRDAT